MTPQFEQKIRQVVDQLTGWCDHAKALTLCREIEARRPEVVCEIGVWGGRSLIPMALACKEFTCGRVIAIDPWDAAASAEGATGENLDWWQTRDHESVYRGFMDSLDRLGVKDVVSVIRGRSDDVTPLERIDIFHLDGNHAEQSIRDIRRFAPAIPIGGLAVLDDTGWIENGVGHVAIAVAELIRMGFREEYALGTGAVSHEIGCERVAESAWCRPCIQSIAHGRVTGA